MASINVMHTLADLEADLSRIATTTRPQLSAVVKRNVEQGNRLAQAYARELSGPHGKNYWKRLTGEMLTPLSGEFGPHGGGLPVGGGWRSGAPNTELERAQDVIGPRLAGDVRDILDRLFW